MVSRHGAYHIVVLESCDAVIEGLRFIEIVSEYRCLNTPSLIFS